MSLPFVAPAGGFVCTTLRSDHFRRGLASAAVGIAVAIIEASWPSTR